MTYRKHCIFFVVYFVMIYISGCQQTDSESTVDTIEPIAINDFEIFGSFEQQGIVRPTQIEVLSDGDVAVLDRQTNLVFLLDSNGEVLTQFGGEGKGPGESITALQLQSLGDDLFVVDSSSLRINQFNRTGDYIRSFLYEKGFMPSPIIVNGDGFYFIAASGRDGKLISKKSVNSDSLYLFGEAMGEQFVPGDLEIEKKALIAGEIPSLYMNDISMSYSNSFLYVFLNAHSRIQKYTEDGKLLWDQEIDFPVNQAIFDSVVERAKNLDSEAVPRLLYSLSLKIINEQVYLLWYTAGNYHQNLVRLDENGHVATLFNFRLDGQVFYDFAIDTQNNFLFLIDSDYSQIYRTKLPL